MKGKFLELRVEYAVDGFWNQIINIRWLLDFYYFVKEK